MTPMAWQSTQKRKMGQRLAPLWGLEIQMSILLLCIDWKLLSASAVSCVSNQVRAGCDDNNQGTRREKKVCLVRPGDDNTKRTQSQTAR